MAIVATFCGVSCSLSDECSGGESPCGEEEGTYRECVRDPPPDVPALSSDRLYFIRKTCAGNDPVCLPAPHHQHICSSREWPPGEVCAQPITLLSDLPGDRVVPIVADLNADGRADLLLEPSTQGAPLGISQSLQAADGSFGPPKDILDRDGHRFWRPHVGDLDGDGATDVVALLIPDPSLPEVPVPVLVVFLSRDGQLVSSATQSLPDSEVQAVADIDGDGAAELLLNTWTEGEPITHFGSRYGVSVLRLDGDRLVQRCRWDVGPADSSYPQTISVADFDGDGRPSVVVASHETFVFSPGDDGYTLDPGITVPNAATLDDFDGDGATDAAVLKQDQSRPYVSVGISDRRAKFSWHDVAQLGRSVQLFGAQVDGHSAHELVALVDYNAKVSIIADAAHAGANDVRTFDLITSQEGTIMADLDGDGRSDIVTSKLTPDGLQILAAFGSCL